MKSGIILILEDEPDLLRQIEIFLVKRNLRVVGASDIKSARELIHTYGEEVALVLVDIDLKDKSFTTGLDFGLEVKRYLSNRPPEFLVNTGHTTAEFYRSAFQLGAATYLVKPTNQPEILNFTRALLMRRELLSPPPTAMEQVRTLAKRSGSGVEAMSTFCRSLLRDDLITVMGVPFLLLIGEGDQAANAGHGLDLPERSLAFGVLQRLAQLNQVSDRPLKVGRNLIPDGLSNAEREACIGIFDELEGAAFVPLVSRDDLRVCLGVVQDGKDHEHMPARIAEIFGAYVQPALTKALADLREMRLMYAEQRSVVDAAADFCLYVGQEQVRLVDRLLGTPGLLEPAASPELQRLSALGENLRNAGEVLSLVGRPSDEGGTAATPAAAASSMAALVSEVWKELSEELGIGRSDLLKIEGDCRVRARAGNLEVAVARILRWLMQRIGNVSGDSESALSVSCRPQERGVEIAFSDSSRRVPKPLRAKVFPVPATPRPGEGGQPKSYAELLDLYLSKVLVEEEDGVLEDRSDEIEGKLGNRFVMFFPHPIGEEPAAV